jgi:hypothetical protein
METWSTGADRQHTPDEVMSYVESKGDVEGLQNRSRR